jgi:hypothetical protein
MTSDHATLAGIKLKEFCAGLIGVRQDLVFADRLAVPAM